MSNSTKTIDPWTILKRSNPKAGNKTIPPTMAIKTSNRTLKLVEINLEKITWVKTVPKKRSEKCFFLRQFLDPAGTRAPWYLEWPRDQRLVVHGNVGTQIIALKTVDSCFAGRN